MGPSVSVVVVCFDHERYVGRAIESVLSQTFVDLELHVIDDGSRDSSGEVIRQTLAAHADPRVSFDQQDNIGLIPTLNWVLDSCQGEFFAFLGSDDFWEPTKLARQLAAIESEHVGCYSDCWIVDQDGHRLGRYGSSYRYHGGDIYEDIVLSRMLPPSPTTLLRLERIKDVGGYSTDLRVLEDRLLLANLAKLGPFAYVDEPLASYRTHGRNTSKARFDDLVADIEMTNDKLLRQDPGLGKWRRRLAAAGVRERANHAFIEGDRRAARRYAWQALRAWPGDAHLLRLWAATFVPEAMLRIRRRLRAGH